MSGTDLFFHCAARFVLQRVTSVTRHRRALVALFHSSRELESERGCDPSRTALANFQSGRHFRNGSRQRRRRTRTATFQRISGIPILVSRLALGAQWSHVGVRKRPSDRSSFVTGSFLSPFPARSRWRETTAHRSKFEFLRSIWNVNRKQRRMTNERLVLHQSKPGEEEQKNASVKFSRYFSLLSQ